VPNFGAGVDQHVNPAVTPTWIFTPNTTAGVASTLRLYNEGRYPVYIGTSGLDQPGGIAIPPSSKAVNLQNVTQTLYAVSGVVIGAVAGTMSASPVTAGSTAITLATTAPTSLAAGTTIIVGSTAGTGWEAQVVNSTTASSQLTFANPLVNDHTSSSPVYLATAQPGQLRVTAGVI
jgi:hypothetical protein